MRQKNYRLTFRINLALVVGKEIDAAYQSHLDFLIVKHNLDACTQMFLFVPPAIVNHRLKQLAGIFETHVTRKELRVADAVTAASSFQRVILNRLFGAVCKRTQIRLFFAGTITVIGLSEGSFKWV